MLISEYFSHSKVKRQTMAFSVSEARRQRILHHMLWPYMVLNLIGAAVTPAHIRISLFVSLVLLVTAFVLNIRRHTQSAAILGVIAAYVPVYSALALMPAYSDYLVIAAAMWSMVGILLGSIWLRPMNLLFVLSLNLAVLSLLPVAIHKLQWTHISSTIAILFVVSTLAYIGNRLRSRELHNLDEKEGYLLQQRQQLKVNIDELNNEIQERGVIENRLRQRENMLSTIMDHVWDGVLLIHGDGTIISNNRFIESLLGFEPGRLHGHSIYYFIPQLSGKLKAVRKDHPLEDFITHAVDREENELPIELSCNVVEQEGNILYVLTVRDISERRRIDAMKDEFIATVSHELRTPITSILGALRLIQGMHASKLEPKVAGLLEISVNNSQTLGSLVNDILDISKIEAGKLELFYEDYAILELANELISSNTTYADQFKVKLRLETEVDVETINTDRVRFKQIFNNLLSNAIKHSPENGEVVLHFTNSQDKLICSVNDHGSGIDEAFKDQVFSKFAQSDSGRKKVIKGTGLGLYLTRSIVEQFNGQVWFESNEADGTTFYVTLPLH